MTIENTTTQIKLVNPEQDAGVMTQTLKSVYDLKIEIDSAKEAIKGALERGFESYKENNDDATKGNYNKFINKLTDELLEGKVSQEVETLENVLDFKDIARKFV